MIYYFFNFVFLLFYNCINCDILSAYWGTKYSLNNLVLDNYFWSSWNFITNLDILYLLKKLLTLKFCIPTSYFPFHYKIENMFLHSSSIHFRNTILKNFQFTYPLINSNLKIEHTTTQFPTPLNSKTDGKIPTEKNTNTTQLCKRNKNNADFLFVIW